MKCLAATLAFHIPEKYSPVPVTLVRVLSENKATDDPVMEALVYGDGSPLKFEDDWDDEDWTRRAQILDKVEKSEIQNRPVKLGIIKTKNKSSP